VSSFEGPNRVILLKEIIMKKSELKALILECKQELTEEADLGFLKQKKDLLQKIRGELENISNNASEINTEDQIKNLQEVLVKMESISLNLNSVEVRTLNGDLLTKKHIGKRVVYGDDEMEGRIIEINGEDVKIERWEEEGLIEIDVKANDIQFL
jgi:hypothetical protein